MYEVCAQYFTRRAANYSVVLFGGVEYAEVLGWCTLRCWHCRDSGNASGTLDAVTTFAVALLDQSL